MLPEGKCRYIDGQIYPDGNFYVLDTQHIKHNGNELKSALNGISTDISNKVDKVEGKGLSTEDYTTAEKTKLSGIETNANNYVHPTTSGNKHIPSGGSSGKILGWSANGTAQWIDNPNIEYNDATESTHGLMSAADKTKLNGIESGATNVTVDSTLSASSTNAIQNKAVYNALSDKVDKVSGKGLSTNDYTTTEKNKLSGIEANANNYVHPTTAGNKHVPTGGGRGKILGYGDSSGTASWIYQGLRLVAHTANQNSGVNLVYTPSDYDFYLGREPYDRYSGSYLISCVNWATNGKPYIGLLTFSGGQISNLTKTDIVTGFTPTISLDNNQISISNCARASIYAIG